MSYKMKHNKSAFPFKSPVKQSQQYTETPDTGPYGSWKRGIYNQSAHLGLGMRRRDQEPTPTPEEYEAQGLNRYGGTDMSI